MTTQLTAEQIETAKKNWYVTHGSQWGDSYISVPHQSAPRHYDSQTCPPDAAGGDEYVGGDHDWRSVVPVAEALDYTGHQQYEVRALAQGMIGEAAEL